MCPLREGFLLPSGCAASPFLAALSGSSFAPRAQSHVARAAHRAQPSDPPSRATEQAQPGVRTLAVPLPCMKRSVGASVSTRRSGRSVPARFGVMVPCARGADLPAALPFATHRHDLCRHTGKAVTPGHPTALREGGFQSAGAAGGKSFRSPRVPDARAALGRRRRSITRTPRGPGADRALRSRAKECGAAAAGETQGRTQPPAVPANQEPSRSEKEETGCEPAGHEKSRHAETTKKRTAHPLGKTRPSRKGRRTSHEPRQAVRAGLSVVTAETTVPGASSHSRGSTAASSCSSSSTGLERSSTTRSSPGISSGGSNSLSCPW